MSSAAKSEENIRRLVGLADCYELLRVMFTYPEESLVDGLASGCIAQDVKACLEDAGAENQEIVRVRSSFERLGCSDGKSLYAGMCRTYSQWYLAPGANVPAFPYESAFRFVLSGRKGIPTLFRTPVSLEVKELMAEAGVVPADAAREPVDSIWNEFSFLAFLFGSWAAAAFNEDSEALQHWRQICPRFWDAHGRAWIPEFMAVTRRLANGLEVSDPYGAFADFGSVVAGVTSQFLEEGLR